MEEGVREEDVVGYGKWGIAKGRVKWREAAAAAAGRGEWREKRHISRQVTPGGLDGPRCVQFESTQSFIFL
jgi:hypothetical protein